MTADELTIRTATADDADAVFRLASELATSFEVERQPFDASLAELLRHPDAWLGVAELSGAVVGYLLGFVHPAFYANGRVAWVEEALVVEGVRRQGVGRAMMDAFEDWARGQGATLVGLATRRAAPFYRALGYEESATYFRRLL